VQGALFVPGSHKVALPRTRNGIAVFSMGSMIPESEALEFESAAHGESHTWRATREFALLGEILRSFEWGALDLLMFDLPPGSERTVQYADFLGPRTSFLLVTIPSEVARGVVARSVAALSKGPNRLLGYVENMTGYYCRDCNAIKPLFVSPDQPPPRLRRSAEASAKAEPASLEIPCLGSVPFDPELARHCDRGIPFAELPETPVRLALEHVAQQLMDSLESKTPASAQHSNELRPGKSASAQHSNELRPGKPASPQHSNELRSGEPASAHGSRELRPGKESPL
ncbi:MAG: Mrp/NBP35 family ATP-binding protein, partial [Actinobacteria bacterium]|nr:Mrp/NBP35 family ATP-binding protein [Actinomycetota bacterium]